MKACASVLISGVCFVSFFALPARADTQIYNNSSYTGYTWGSSSSYVEMLDYGTSPGGRISKFVFAYTSGSTVGTIWVRFYRYTDYFDPGYLIKQFALTNVPSANGYVNLYEYVIPEADRFELPAGDFGYSFEFSRATTYAGLATGGTGNDNYYWEWDDFFNDWWRYPFGGYGDGFYLQLYTAPSIDEITCDIKGYKFNDTDGDGFRDGGEPGLAHWEIYIDENEDGAYQASEPNAVTDPNGMYFFENLPAPADYIIREFDRDGWVQTLPGGSEGYEYLLEAEPNNLYAGYDFGNQVWDGFIQTLYPTADTYVKSTEPGTNFAASNSLTAGKSSSTGAVYRSVLKFDMAEIPDGCRIVSAALVLHSNFVPFADVEIEAWFTSEYWQESEVTWNNPVSASYDSPTDTIVVVPGENRWDVSEVADDRYCSGRELSILLQSADESYPYYVSFWSSQLSMDEQPRLVVQYEPVFGGGAGTGQDPYQIWTAEQMNSIGLYANRWDRSYKLMADISMADYPGAAYNPIGQGMSQFKGIFDGGGHSISDFEGPALFGFVAWGRIQRLALIAPNVSGNSALVEQLDFSDIAECRVLGGTVQGGMRTGGLIGSAFWSNIGGCYSSANVSGTDDVGGLIGTASTLCRITDSAATGTVTGQDAVGGFIGSADDTAFIHCYAAGEISGISSVGGFCGTYEDFSLTVESDGCFWDFQVSNLYDSALGTGMPTAEMMNQAMFVQAGWDFAGETGNGRNDDWSIPPGGGYPVLWYQLASPPPLPTFAGGNGTSGSPYLIATAEQLNSLGHNTRLLDKHFRLVSDLDLAGDSFTAIADGAYAFGGHFDGDNKSVRHAVISAPSAYSNVGFFGAVCGGQVIDLTLQNAAVQAVYARGVGSLAGLNHGGMVQNCHSLNADVTGQMMVGGLVGGNYWHALISGCSVTGRIEESGQFGIIMSPVGGLVGENSWWSHIHACGANVDIFGQEYLGGLVGSNTLYGVLSDCYGLGTINADVTESYVSAGGLVGRSAGRNTYDRCYAAVHINAPPASERLGVLVGSEQTGTYTDCFWDEQLNGTMPEFGSTSTSTLLIDSSGQTTDAMRAGATYQGQGWDFVHTWRICEGMSYPRLRAHPAPAGDFGCPEGVELTDLLLLADEWLQLRVSLNCDIAPVGAPDGRVNLLDYAVFAENWLAGTD